MAKLYYGGKRKMITKYNMKNMLISTGFSDTSNEKFEKYYPFSDCSITVDFKNEKIIYPEDKGFKVNVATTTNFSEPENFVVLECVNRLLDKGYRPENIELERTWALGHEQKSGRADICVCDQNGKMLFIVECKTFGTEYNKEMKNILSDGGQLISYWQQERGCRWLVLYASNINDKNEIEYTTDSIDCSDDDNIINLAKKDSTILLYKNAHTVSELYEAWKETYERRFSGDVIFRDDSVAYDIGAKPLRKKDLKDFSENDKIVNRFEEILRHNNVSDKENAFNRLIALFICKLVDEIQKTDNDIVEFQYKVGTDTYESLQDRLQRLHKEGMEKFMREEIFYVSDDYAENLVKQYTKQKRVKMIEELRNTLRILKFYTNNDFAFKDVHNEELFYQNGKILVEIVQLFQDYRIIGSADMQMLGDLFEQLLNKGFKQNEGQFFTPIPITRFIWDSLPLEQIMTKTDGIEYPKIIDYACGAGHFLTEGFEAVEVHANAINSSTQTFNRWVEKKIFGIEKDYRLARVSKISLFMHGAGDGNIIFGDGLENYPDKEIVPESFDVLVANPPYSVKAFKPHLKLSNNQLDILDKISNDGSEIETLFVERISQLLKPNGVAAVILPSSILNKENESFISARESLLKNFNIIAISTLGSKTFGATGTNTVILFLQKFNEPPKRTDMVIDSVEAILSKADIDGWEDETILRGYLKKIGVKKDTYNEFLSKNKDYAFWKTDNYFNQHYNQFVSSSEYTKKSNQKTFIKLSGLEQKKWFNQKFYEYAVSVEQEKLFYYSLVYNQNTLIISAPDENKEQEKFLGYKWSNRKGQEGIQIIKAGGCLYNAFDRADKNSIAGLIRNAFSDGDMFDVEELDQYYYRLRLQDMLDFSGTAFSKSIKTTPTRVLKDIPGLTNYRLSDKNYFDLSIGNRVLSDEVVENGSIPIYSANVFEEFGKIDKQNITDFSMPSILWGIDGDWMVNILPANKPFYPTDHCGVLRIKTDDIMPKYMALALQVEGEFERFSRSNRASTQRIANLIIQIPSVADQQKIVDEIKTIDQKIADEQAIITEQSEKVKSKFVEMFGGKSFVHKSIEKISKELFAGGDKPNDYSS
jgi:type I restriction-modification system DNA methylase subunit